MVEEGSLLKEIQYPKDLRKLDVQDLPELCAQIRAFIIDTLSGVGGHFASNLGAVELTVALHYVFDTPNDKLVWDVGHQTYPHKILTGRKSRLHTVRKFGGLSGFPKREESEYDLYNTGHAGTSISQALGEAIARDMRKENYNCIAIIGDASISAGMALEALNHAGDLGTNLLVILNDNYMSISKNVGSISKYLNSIISSHVYNRSRKYFLTFLKWLPFVGPAVERFAKNMERGFKNVFTPGGLFEDLGFRYIGPTNGHDVIALVTLLQKVKDMKGPILLHAITQKGKGYLPAEEDPIKYHGVAPFRKEDGSMKPAATGTISYSKIVGKTLTQLTEEDNLVSAITPAMIEGSGLSEYADKFPDHVFDVGIAEQHSVAFAGALANGKTIPFMCIYSTFLVRAMDQLVEDVSLMNLPVRFVIDRAGCVGPDGETHQGLFDLGFLAAMPNMTILIPSSGQDIIDCLYFMKSYQAGPIAIRFPKASVPLENLDFKRPNPIQLGNSRILRKGNQLAIISVGSMLETSLAVADRLEGHGISVGIIDLFCLRPLDLELLESELEDVDRFVILDESYLDAGASGYILQRLSGTVLSKFIKTFAFPDEPIHHGERKEVFEQYGLSPDTIVESIRKELVIR